MKRKIEIEINREEMLALLDAQDYWEFSFLEEMNSEEILKFGVDNGVWKEMMKDKEVTGIVDNLNNERVATNYKEDNSQESKNNSSSVAKIYLGDTPDTFQDKGEKDG